MDVNELFIFRNVIYDRLFDRARLTHLNGWLFQASALRLATMGCSEVILPVFTGIDDVEHFRTHARIKAETRLATDDFRFADRFKTRLGADVTFELNYAHARYSRALRIG